MAVSKPGMWNGKQDKARTMRHMALAQQGNRDRKNRISPQHMQIILAKLAGYTIKQIAERMKYTAKSIEFILRQPKIRAEINAIVAAQRERIVSGDFGVLSMAKANAERMAKTIIDQATGDAPDVKPGDRRRAAEIGLKLSGDLVEKKISEHVHKLVGELTTEEMETFLARGEMPDRLRRHFEVLGIEYKPSDGPPSD